MKESWQGKACERDMGADQLGAIENMVDKSKGQSISKFDGLRPVMGLL